MSETRILDCVVIGAGPGGLVCTKELLEQGLDRVLCLERGPAIGGVFTQTYDSLVLTSSATISMFSDFWIGDGQQHRFWTKDEALDYWRRYAEHYGVLDKVRLETEVVALRTAEQDWGRGWELELGNGERLRTRRVALAVGNNTFPHYPSWARELSEVEVMHAQDYRNAAPFAGKRVLMVGGGESGSDVALEVAAVARAAWVSLRESTGWIVPRMRGDRAADISTHRGVWGLPRAFGPNLSQAVIRAELAKGDPVHDTAVELNRKVRAKKGIWGTYGTKTFALPKAIVHHGCKIVGEIVKVEDGGRRLTCATGEVLEDVDAVVFCTGYTNRVPFLPEALRAMDPRALYKHMFDAELGDRIAWIGWARPTFGSQFPIMEMQARLFALICAERHHLPQAAEMERAAAADRATYLEQFEDNAHRVRSIVDYHRYMDDMAGLIGCEPPLADYLLRHPQLWLRMAYGAIQSTQYRLRGPGSKPELAREILAKLPVSQMTHIVKAGLEGRARYIAKGLMPKLIADRIG